MADALGDLRQSIGDLANSEPVIAAGRGIAKVGELAQGAYDRAVAALTPTSTPAARRRTTDIQLPSPRRSATKRPVTRGSR